ncbi:SixA phosphatase family protein [Actinopolyspora mortivallis]|uniref:SixA phosphatase family protein n=1 Tax=Actinopolyspora mortivallis TaxID=33906 RepID=UPI000375FD02|nr:histidine phosphatase family protein [Actinopolyspora mortivallis]
MSTTTRHRVIVLRHAKSERNHPVDDHERPLAERGRREAPLAGSWLREHGHRVDLLQCSTALRTRQTCEAVLAELETDPEVVFDPRMYGADAATLLEVIHGLPENAHTTLLIAHNPGLSELVGALSGQAVELKTSAMAVLEQENPWSGTAPGHSVLVETVTPRPPTAP